MLDVARAGRGWKCAGRCRRLDDATTVVSGEERSDAVAARGRVDGNVGDGEVAGPAERDEGDAIPSRKQASASEAPEEEVKIQNNNH